MRENKCNAESKTKAELKGSLNVGADSKIQKMKKI